MGIEHGICWWFINKEVIEIKFKNIEKEIEQLLKYKEKDVTYNLYVYAVVYYSDR